MKKARIYTDDFNRCIESTKRFTASVTGREMLQYIKLEFDCLTNTMAAIALDGYRMSVEHARVSDCEESFEVFIKGTVKLPKGKFAEISLENKEVIIRCDGLIFGFSQPDLEYLQWKKLIPQSKESYKIAVNGDYLLSALQAAKVSCAKDYHKMVVLEFRGKLDPIILRTNDKNIKMILPIRVRDEEDA